MGEDKETIQKVGRVELKEAFLGDGINIKISGPKGSVDLEKEYLRPYGYKIVRGDTSRFDDKDKKIYISGTELVNPDESSNKQVKQKASTRSQIVDAFHETGHVLADPNNDLDSQSRSFYRKGKLLRDASGFNMQTDTDFGDTQYALSSIEETAESGGWLQMAYIAKDIKSKTGYDIRQEFENFDAFYDSEVFPSYESYRRGHEDLILDGTTAEGKSREIFDNEGLKAQMKDIWESMDED